MEVLGGTPTVGVLGEDCVLGGWLLVVPDTDLLEGICECFFGTGGMVYSAEKLSNVHCTVAGAV